MNAETQSGAVATVADAVAAAIAASGVEVAFTFPGGGSNLALLDSLQNRGVATVLTRSEVGGALMASTVADISGVPGVLVVGLGPSVASAVNGVAHAWLDRSPLLVVADKYSEAEAGTTGHQLLDQAAIFAPIVKASVDTPPDNAGEAVTRAVAIALDHPRGPVLIEMRRDRARLPQADTAPRKRSVRTIPAAGLQGEVSAVASALCRARRPVVLVGAEARDMSDPAALVTLAELLESPVLATYKAKGVFPETHRLAAGILTGAEIERPLLGDADLMVGIGVDPVELLARPWPYGAEVVALRRTAEPDRYLRPRWTVAGDLDTTVQELLAALDEPSSEWEPGEAAWRAGRIRDELRTGGVALPVWRAVEIAQDVAGDSVVTVDAGAHMFAVTWFWRSQRANAFHISNGLATMGFSVPAAIGAAIASPNETVLAFTGDGGFTINAAELETAARVGAKVIVLVINDASLSLIRVKQAEIGLPRSNVDFVRSDFARVAEGLGVRGAHASTEPELHTALREAIAASETTVIDVAVDGSEYAELHRQIRG